MKEGDKGAGVAHATPRPWERHHLYVVRFGEDNANVAACGDPHAGTTVGYTVPDLRSEGLAEAAANADLIVRAVNAHDELVAALKAAYGTILDADLPTERENEVCDQIARALDKVEA